MSTASLPQRLRGFVARRRQFLLFCAVGGSGVLVNMVVFHSTLWAWRGHFGAVDRFAANVAVTLAWLVSVATNFGLNDRLTFGSRQAEFKSSSRRRLARYYTAALSGYGLQLGILNLVTWLLPKLGHTLSGEPGAVASLFALLVAHQYGVGNLLGIAAGTVSNYLLSRTWVFR